MSLARSIVVLLVSLAALLLTSCSPTVPLKSDPVSQEQNTASTVAVSTQSISSVVVVSGDVQANPRFWASAPDEGAVHFLADASTQGVGAQLAVVGGKPAVLQAAGLVSTRLVKEGQIVAANTPIAEITYSGFGIEVKVPPAELYRIYAQPSVGKASVGSGPSGIDCTLVPAPVPATGSKNSNDQGPGAQDDGYRPVICLLPLSAKVVAGLPAKVGVKTAQKENVLVLPVSAVSGSSEQGEVTLVKGKRRELTSVTLGISDGAYIEITGGLHAGDKVLSYAPRLD